MANGDMDPAEEHKNKCLAWGPGFLCGARTFTIALLVILAFVIVAVYTMDIDKLYDAALLVLGFFFGVKATTAASNNNTSVILEK